MARSRCRALPDEGRAADADARSLQVVAPVDADGLRGATVVAGLPWQVSPAAMAGDEFISAQVMIAETVKAVERWSLIPPG